MKVPNLPMYIAGWKVEQADGTGKLFMAKKHPNKLLLSNLDILIKTIKIIEALDKNL